MAEKSWIKIGKADELKKQPLQKIEVAGKKIALSYENNQFGAIGGECLHVGGPLGEGCLNKEGYAVCPWHGWMFHRVTGEARPGIPAAECRYELKEEKGDLYINPEALTKEKHAPHPKHPLAREVTRGQGPTRVLGISTTVMNKDLPRFSTSEFLLNESLQHAFSVLGCQTRLIKLNDLNFRHCEGYYSKSEHACIWPCSITEADPKDELALLYEALVFWADIVIVATPIRWGAASSLYYKMAERLNCIQNQLVTDQKALIQNKVASFIITGGQDNVQAVAGQMGCFFGELGFCLPPFHFIGHSRGWDAEDMENNVREVKENAPLKEEARLLVERASALSKVLRGESHDR